MWGRRSVTFWTSCWSRRRAERGGSACAARAEALGDKGTVSIEEMVLAQRDDLVARVDLLDREGAQTQGEGAEEITRLKETAGKAR